MSDPNRPNSPYSTDSDYSDNQNYTHHYNETSSEDTSDDNSNENSHVPAHIQEFLERLNELLDLYHDIRAYIHEHEIDIFNSNSIAFLVKGTFKLMESEDRILDAGISRPLQRDFEPMFDRIGELVDQSDNNTELKELLHNYRNKYFETISPLDYVHSNNMTYRRLLTHIEEVI